MALRTTVQAGLPAIDDITHHVRRIQEIEAGLRNLVRGVNAGHLHEVQQREHHVQV